MTRSVTIVNTSNWEHEDVRAIIQYADGRESAAVTLKPGDQMTCGPYTNGQVVQVQLAGQEPATPIPFKDADDNQDWPKVEVHKPTPSGGEG